MKIVPATLLKVGSQAKIIGVIDDLNTEQSQKLAKHLTAVGFVPGNTIKLAGKNGDIFSLKINGNNPFAVAGNIARKLNVSAEDEDVFESEAARKSVESVSGDIKKLVAFIKKKIVKN